VDCASTRQRKRHCPIVAHTPFQGRRANPKPHLACAHSPWSPMFPADFASRPTDGRELTAVTRERRVRITRRSREAASPSQVRGAVDNRNSIIFQSIFSPFFTVQPAGSPSTRPSRREVDVPDASPAPDASVPAPDSDARAPADAATTDGALGGDAGPADPPACCSETVCGGARVDRGTDCTTAARAVWSARPSNRARAARADEREGGRAEATGRTAGSRPPLPEPRRSPREQPCPRRS
jgi:hypothetical protein